MAQSEATTLSSAFGPVSDTHRGNPSGRYQLLVWDFTFRIRRWQPRELRAIHGASHLKFTTDGKIGYHRDYWDAAEELYAKLPLIGPVLRFLRRRLA